MLSYELAKELKDAGFPFERGGTHLVIDEETDHYFFPTLSELIEACGIHFYSLTNNLNGKWTASHEDGREFTHFSPDEAVAKLYLALHPPVKE